MVVEYRFHIEKVLKCVLRSFVLFFYLIGSFELFLFSRSAQETPASTPAVVAAAPVQINAAPVVAEVISAPIAAPVAVVVEAEVAMSTPSTPALDSETLVNDSGEEQAHSVSSSIQEKDPEVSSSGIVEESSKQELLSE